MSEHFIERMTWPEVEAAIESGVDTVLIPIGTTEQHGHHMPLDTDCVIARALCARTAEAAEAEGLSVLVAPTVNVSLSWYHMQFPGTHPPFDDDLLRRFPRDLRLARPPRLRAARRGQRPRRQRRRADGRGQPLLRDHRAGASSSRSGGTSPATCSPRSRGR